VAESKGIASSSVHNVASSNLRDQQKSRDDRKLRPHPRLHLVRPWDRLCAEFGLVNSGLQSAACEKMPGLRAFSIAMAVAMQVISASAFAGPPMIQKLGLWRPVGSFGCVRGHGIAPKFALGGGGRGKGGVRLARAARLSTVRASVHEEWEQFVLDIQKEIISEAEAADGKV
jgi:hypothetical protein